MSETKKRRSRKARRVMKWIKRLILLVLVLAAALFGAKFLIGRKAAQEQTGETYTRAQVMRGAMEETVYGTGTTSASSQPNVLAEADGTLTELRAEIGDEVKKGDILGVMTNDEIDDTITDLEFKLWDLDAQITDTSSGSKVTKVEAPVAGRVMAIYAKPGDDALAVFRREGALAIISTDERMKVQLTGESALGLSLDEKVTVIGDHIYAEGTVVELTRQGTQATVTIMEEKLPVNEDFDGDGKVDMILGAEVEVRNAAGDTIGKGALEANKPMAVSAFGGTISRVDAILGAEVGRGERMFQLEDSPLTLKIEDLRLQREAAARELEDAVKQRESLILVAPCDGTVASLEVKEGDEITSGTLIGSVQEGEDMKLTINVDELDVVNVQAGQKVTITVDALSGAELTGKVVKIAPVGESSGGVTTYGVELAFEAAGTGVRSGMNATGEIQVNTTEDTLYVPVEALMTINNETYLMVADGGTTALNSVAKQTGTGRMGTGAGRGQGMPGDMGGAPGMDAAPNMDAEPNMSDAEPAEGVAETESKGFFAGAFDKLHNWLYEGVEQESDNATGTLVKVKVGMQNDDYAEILSGVNEGDVVLYTASQASSMFGSMMAMPMF